MKRYLTLFALLLLLPLQAQAEIVVENAWVRLPPPVADTAAGYMTIRNTGDKDVTIVVITSDAADSPEFHTMRMEDGRMIMEMMEKLVVPAHGEVDFMPGANHLMLVGLKRTLEAGEHVMLHLETDDGEMIMVHAVVRDMRHQDDGMKMEHGQHGGH